MCSNASFLCRDEEIQTSCLMKSSTNTILTLSQRVTPVLNLGKIVFAIYDVKLQTNSSLFITLLRNFLL